MLYFLVLRWLDTVFKKNGNLRFRSVFLENHYLFEDKEYFCYVQQHLKSSNSFTEVAQLPLLWQQIRFKMADILALKDIGESRALRTDLHSAVLLGGEDGNKVGNKEHLKRLYNICH